MSKIEKSIKKMKEKPTDFTYDELKRILNNFGFYEYNKGKTSGSRVVFIKENDISKKIEFHKPHPGKILKLYQIKNIVKILEEWRIL